MRHAEIPQAALSRPSGAPARGVLRVPSRGHHHGRWLPCATLSDVVAHFWEVHWDVPEPTLVETLPHPSVHIVFETSDAGSSAQIVGIPRRRFTATLRGRGQVFGIKFRPAMFSLFTSESQQGLTDRRIALEHVFGREATAWTQSVQAATSLGARMNIAEAFLGLRTPVPDAEALALRDLIERVAVDPSVVRVNELVQLLGVNVRSLQRRFQRRVGVTPKRIVQCYRLHEAAERLKRASPPFLAALAAELGYSDQAHFARDFRATLGCTPGAFLAERRAREVKRDRDGTLEGAD